jgi:hypothetical protein
MGKFKVHKHCGGVIRNNQCTKCGKKFGLVKRFFAQYYDEVDQLVEGFSPKKYRRRIRKGDDIF